MEVKLIIPTSLNEITLGQYQEFAKLDITKELEVQSKMIEIFCKVPVEVVRSMKAKDITDICTIINNMFDVFDGTKLVYKRALTNGVYSVEYINIYFENNKKTVSELVNMFSFNGKVKDIKDKVISDFINSIISSEL